MRLAYITNARIPSERANAAQTVQMCAAFAAAGAVVTLYHPARRNLPEFAATDIWQYYGAPKTFRQCPVPCVDLFHLSGGRMGLERPIFLLQTLTFAVSLIRLLLQNPADMYYSRDPFVAALILLAMRPARKRIFFEAHTLPTSSAGRAFRRWVLNQVGGTAAISHALEKLYRDMGARSVMTAPDGVSLSRFAHGLSHAEARQRLGLPLNERLIVYTGGLYPGRGIEEMILAVKGLEALLVIVGGKNESVANNMKQFAAQNHVANARFEGHRPPTDIPIYLSAADVLAMPYSRRTVAPGGITTDWMSPLKMFEYMAAARPIVASDLPALREVLNENNALLIPPDDAVALAAAFRRLLADSALGSRLAAQARRDAESHTWEARARSILEFANGRNC
ncbi:MAG: glycosyltransferase family 4 protein [Chloroflexi bacterium]|nr:glycosyltransferase family 4 protein [Chloroflexota bacterium]